MPKQSLPDTPADVLATNLTKFRNKRGWTQQDFAEMLAAYGLEWDRSTVAKVEGRGRQVTVDEACTVAYALGVPLVALLCHSAANPQMRVTPNTTTSPHFVWWWIVGDYPSGGQHPGELKDPAVERLYFEACQDQEAIGERLVPGLQRLRTRVRHAQTTAGATHAGEKRRLVETVRLLEEIRDSAKEIADRVLREYAGIKKGK